jgi:fatty-acyl-CoA synthase
MTMAADQARIATPGKDHPAGMIASQADVEALERQGMGELPHSSYDMIAATARRQPEAPALSFFLTADTHTRPEVWSYRQLLEGIHASANLFHALGVGASEVVAYVLPNLPETHLTIWGAQVTGAVFAVNPLLEPAAIAELLRAGKAKVLVTLAPFPGTDLWTKIQPVLDQVPSLRHVVLVNLADHVPGPKGWVAKMLQWREARRLHGVRGVAGALPAGVHVHDFRQALARQQRGRLLSARRIQPSDVSSLFCTGGTTGLPKIAVRTHANEVSNAWSASRFFGQSIGASKTLFCGLPLFHVNAVLVTGLVPFWQGAHVVLGTPQGYRGQGVIPRFWEIVEHHRINFFSGVPTLYAALLEQALAGRDVSSLEFGLCGAAPLPAELMRRFQEKTGLKMLEGYGLTEGTCVSTCNPPGGERRIGSIGLRIPHQAMKAVQLDERGHYLRDCAVGEVGLLVISGPNVFQGYKDAAHNAGLWIDCGDGRRWLNTGDLGRQDSEGYFYLTGRKKELIIRGGHNLDPALIEEPLLSHPAVQLAAAVGRPDAHAGEVPVAYVQLKPSQSITEAELLAHARIHIAERAAVPKAIHIVEAIPLTGVGKIFKPDLKHREIADALRCELAAAGIMAQRVDAATDPQLGILVTLGIAQDEHARAQAVLGRFPFTCRLVAET